MRTVLLVRRVTAAADFTITKRTRQRTFPGACFRLNPVLVAQRFSPTLAVVSAVALLGIFLTGCAREVPMQPAEDANNPACADVIVRLPDTVAEQEQRRTNAQATGAWGEPAAVLLYCGIEPSGPTTDSCVNVNGVDWVIDKSNEPMYRFEAYGRSPGLEVIVNAELVSGTAAVLDLTQAVSQLPQERQCSNLVDELDLQ